MEGIPTESPRQSPVSGGRPWWKACCIGCLFLMLAVFAGIAIFIHALNQPQVQRLSQLPENYPQALAPYRLDDAASITYLPGASRGVFTRILTAPAMILEKMRSTDQSLMPGELFQSTDEMDTVTITWKGLSDSPEDVLAYYASLFKKAGIPAKTLHDDATATDVVAANSTSTFMQVKLQDLPDIPGIDTMEVLVTYPNQKL